jgi:tetratricopeptide (TPR) repeat protein
MIAAVSPRWLPWLAALAVAAIVAVVFAPALDNGFVDWDDEVNVTSNQSFRGLGWAQLRWMFSTTLLGQYIPLTWLSLALDHALWGMNPRGYHATNVLLHAVNAALVVLVARRLLGPLPLPGALAAGLVFGLHPLRVESVAWVTERRDVLSLGFALLAVLAWLRSAERSGPGRGQWLAASLGAYAASLLSKQLTMTLPLVLAILDVYPLRRRAWLEKLPYAMLGVAGAVVALVAIRTASMTSWEQYGAMARLGMTAWSLGFYLSRTLVPIDLSPLYELPPVVDPLAPPFLLSGLVTVALSAAAVGLCRRAPWLATAWATYVVMVLPVAGPVHAGFQLAHDRYSYLACLPWAILAGAGAGSLVRAWRAGTVSRAVATAGVGAMIAVVAAWAGLTARQIGVWRDPVALWEQAVRVDPMCAVCRSNLGRSLLDAGRLGEAEAELWHAIALRPERPAPHTTLGAVHYRRGRRADAAREWALAVRLGPRQAEPLNNLGVLHAEAGRYAEAARYFQAALDVRPEFAAARDNLARARERSGR